MECRDRLFSEGKQHREEVMILVVLTIYATFQIILICVYVNFRNINQSFHSIISLIGVCEHEYIGSFLPHFIENLHE